MIKILMLFILMAFLPANYIFAQVTVSPSVYYTYGNYSNENYSNDFSAFTTVKIAAKGDFLIAGFDNLLIKNPNFDFDQKMFVTGLIKNIYPVYLKLNYAHINGDFNSNLTNTTIYTDKTNLFNGGIIYNIDLFFFGFSYTYLTLDGFKSVNSNQLEVDFIWRASPYIIFFVKPLYSKVSDGRELFSSSIKLQWFVSSKFNLDAETTLGRRAYYFNSDLLTIYNQDETQETTIAIKGQYKINNALQFIASYQFADFNDFNINYFIGGIKFDL